MKLSTKFVERSLSDASLHSKPPAGILAQQTGQARENNAGDKKQGVVALDIELDALKAAWILPRDERGPV